MRLILLTAFALTAFAFNSILCRLALRGGEADAAGFTLVRLVSGAVVLAIISVLVNNNSIKQINGSWRSAFYLFAYAICFSFAYLGLTAATGALILFGCVQFTMVATSIARGERPSVLEWIGLAVAIFGLIYLVFPGLTSPPLMSALLMAAAGVAWGFYTLRGKSSTDPLRDTAGNFVRAIPMIVLVSIPLFRDIQLSTRGVTLAVLSGAIASGVGYTVWYKALKHLTATRAAVVQLAVPVIAAAGGIVFLSEVADLRIIIASALILGGIAITLYSKQK